MTDLPKYFLPRPEDARLKAMVLSGEADTIIITGAPPTRTAGIGKSVSAAALVHDPEVQHAFPDGVIWLTVGHYPALTALLSQLATALEGTIGIYTPTVFEDEKTSATWLRARLEDKVCLLVLDDVRSAEHFAAFAVLGPRSRLVLTTRDTRWLADLSKTPPQEGTNHPEKKKKSRRAPSPEQTILPNKRETLILEPWNDSQALALLAAWSGQSVAELSPVAREIVRECGNLPPALAIIGGLLRVAPDSQDSILERIRELDPELFRRKFADDPWLAPVALRMLQVAVNALGPEGQRRYLDLAVFPENIQIPVTVLRTLWTSEGSVPDMDVDTIVADLVQRALVQRDGDDQIRLHAFQEAYLQKYSGNRTPLHTRFLRSIAAQFVPLSSTPSLRTAVPWHLLSRDEPYLWRYLPYHLVNAGQPVELKQLLTDLNWLVAQLEVTDLLTLRSAYALLPHEEDLQRVHEVLRLATPVLLKDETQLVGQLLGRLFGLRVPGLRGLLKQAMRWKGTPWLRPLTDSLPAPGGPLERTLATPRDRTQAIALTSDGRRFIAGSIEGRINVWDLDQGLELYTLTSQHLGINGLTILPDDRRVLLATNDGMLELWDIEQRRVVGTLKGHRDSVNGVVLTQNGRQAISVSSDGTLKGWNLEQQLVMYTLKATGPVRAVAIFPDGNHAVSAAGNGVLQVWDLVRRTEKRTLTGGHQAPVMTVAVTPDGHRAISGSLDMTLKVWNLEQGTVLHTMKGHTGAIRALAVTPDGQWIISASTDGTLKIWDLERGLERCTLSGHCAEVCSVAVTWDGRALSGSADRTVKVWDLERGADLHTLTGHRDAVNAVALLPGGEQFLSASNDRTLKVWSMKRRGAALQILKGHTRDVTALAVGTEGHRAVSASKDKTIKVWDIKQGREIHTLTGHSAPIRTVAITPDGRCAISGSSDCTLCVWDLDRGNLRYTLTGHQEAVTALSVIRDDVVLSASLDGRLKLWDPEQGTELWELVEKDSAPAVPIFVLAVPTDLSADQMDGPWDTPAAAAKQWAIAGAEDGTLQIWAMEPGRGRYLWPAHEGAVTALTVTSDGRRAVSGSADHTLRVWDLPHPRDIFRLIAKNRDPRHERAILPENPACIAEFTGESAILTCIIATDGLTVIAGEKSGRIHVLRLEEAEGRDLPN
ncbi:WD repeat protein [Gammaproteobacteria bacterium]